MEFYVYDNMFTFNGHVPNNGDPLTRIEVTNIQITADGRFFFSSGMTKEEHNVSLNKPYVHLHPGINSTTSPQFAVPPLDVTPDNLFYDPNRKSVIVKKGIFNSIKFQKRVVYYGAELPKKATKIKGSWILDYYTSRIYFILDYFPIRKNYDYGDEPATPAQYAKVAELESKIEKLNANLSTRHNV